MRIAACLLAVPLILSLAAGGRAQEALVPGLSPGAGEYLPAAEPWWTWQAGVEATYLSLEMRALEDASSGAADFGFEAAPRIWLQAQNACGWGGQVRWWQYDAEGAGQTTVIEPIDAEATRSFCLGDSRLLATLGGRQGAITANSNLAVIDLSGLAAFDAVYAQRTDEFHGGGITASLAGEQPLGDSCWSLFGSVRGSALWGREYRTGTTTYFNNGPLGTIGSYFLDDQARLEILEVQVGAQWLHDLVCCRGQLFVRTAFEYQHWNTTAFQLEGSFAGQSQLDADLYGVTLAVGVVR
jgi:hypothetical protein